ncbi:uncharacterized protein TM35_000181390 [Trypanosoma theileri]|uniref:Uncharacterized protein n=1 Tax=Trypanosoma theileri TaxID=67003 RepID=A0A1X0NTS8_9TRYP|nr:uncharacterized protein TM35_000181390 [Trypanosoma theileri]ORC88082.1 hypothetical protein TM35_000181390 [Trypanosoma theileri]
MSVDDVIARHRARLDEHRRFLDNNTLNEVPSLSAQVNPGVTVAPDTDTNRSQPRSEIENTEFSPQPLKPQAKRESHIASSFFFASPVVSSHQKRNVHNQEGMQRCQSAKNITEEQRIQRRREVYLKQARTLQDTAFLNQKGLGEKKKHQEEGREEGEISSDLYTGEEAIIGGSDGQAEACRAASTPLSFFGYMGMQEQIAMEERRFEEQLRCAGRYYITRPDAMYIKSQRWLESRERLRRQLQREQTLKSLDGCSFHPNLKSPPHKTADPHKRGNACPSRPSACALRDEAGVAAHLERLREARRRRAAAGWRLSGRVAGTWTNRLTVPVAFTFGRRRAAIPALRRPYTAAATPLTTEDTQEEEKERNSGGDAAEKVKANAAEEEEEEEVVKVEVVDMNAATVHARRRATLAVERVVSRLEKTIALLKDEMAEKDRMLLQQKSEILLLRRDLEVAKTTVRRLSLQDVAQGEWTDEITAVREASVSGG